MSLVPLRCEIIDVYETGVLFSSGNPVKVLTNENGLYKGVHFYFQWFQQVHTGPTVTTVKGIDYQLVTTADGEEFTVSSDFGYHISDPIAAFTKITDYEDVMDDFCQGLISRLFAETQSADLFEQRGDIEKRIEEEFREKAEEWGIHIESFWFLNFGQPQTIRHQFDALPLGVSYHI